MSHMLTPQELLSLGGSASATAGSTGTGMGTATVTDARAGGKKVKGVEKSAIRNNGSGSAGGLAGAGSAGGGKPLKFSYEWPAMGVPGGKWVADHALPWAAAADKETDKDKKEEGVDAWEGFKWRLKEQWERVCEEDYEPLLRLRQEGGGSSSFSSGGGSSAGKSCGPNGKHGAKELGKRKRGKNGSSAVAGSAAVSSLGEALAPVEQTNGFVSDHQQQFFSLCTSYSDVLHSRRPCAQSKFGTPLDAQAITDAYLLHAMPT
ncbi:hypothetical protein CLOP_g7585 [Closterium sp. NIES-67]|nr:hypothetical protein CLOP_g7585 [Closterium sp. NIES-67]